VKRVLMAVAAALVGASASAAPDRCVVPAAQYHSVNESILRAILMVESSNRPNVVSKNRNSSIDVGIAGINSIHFKDLAKHGITPERLMDPCVSTYVAAWKVSKHMARWGNNWKGIAAYHSITPYHNRRYQILIYNQLIAQGVVSGRRLAVPPLRPPQS